MTGLRASSLTSLFFDQAARQGDKPFLWAKKPASDGTLQYQSLSWRETAEKVNALARGLIRLGLERGDRVCLVAENRPEWLIADLAIMAAGGVSVPAYVTNGVAEHQHVLSNSGARFAIVSTAALAAKLLPAAARADVAHVIALEPLRHDQTATFELHGWDAVMENGRASDVSLPQLARSDLACIIHTSGTGGAPKGVMLSHGAILANCEGALALLEAIGLGHEVFLSFLPLSHSYEHTAGLYVPIMIGAEVYYAEGIDTLAANMAEAHPTIMTAVPRLYETMQGRILRGLERAKPLQRKLFFRAVTLGRKAIETSGEMTLLDKLENWLLGLLVRRKVRARFGGRLKAFISGGAPLNPEVGLFFTALGVNILQGYGQTESAPVISCNFPDSMKMDTVGPPLPGVEVKIAEDGEILVRGELVMQGYWNEPKATAETIRDGWLHTGDIGLIDEAGRLKITDRKKDIIVNSGGDNISPQRVEGFLTLEPEIAQAMVIGDKKPYLVALIVPDETALKDWARASGKSEAEALADPAFKNKIGEAVKRATASLSVIERVRHFALADEPFAIANQELTPSLKIRRHIIKARYGERLESLYR
ncbi:MAG TPA: AMP-dependent synthetase/ligase [Alphaproteobacteria bacterium]|nr:AMP-dependent synthetase/ligase [Alphaproteobacteria bacterium]